MIARLGADNSLTLLVMSTIGVPLYSARGLTQTLTPVSEAKPTPRRTINGELRWLGLTQMQKYESTISCTDQEAPAFVWLHGSSYGQSPRHDAAVKAAGYRYQFANTMIHRVN